MDIEAKFPGRSEQIDLLYHLWQDPLSCGPNVWLFGCPGTSTLHSHQCEGTGKTALTHELLLRITGAPVFVNCVECYDSQELFSAILGGLGIEDSAGANITKFLLLLKLYLPKETTFLVFDKAEALPRNLGPHGFSTLLRLSELVTFDNF
jgi:hypothetical protein